MISRRTFMKLAGKALAVIGLGAATQSSPAKPQSGCIRLDDAPQGYLLFRSIIECQSDGQGIKVAEAAYQKNGKVTNIPSGPLIGYFVETPERNGGLARVQLIQC